MVPLFMHVRAESFNREYLRNGGNKMYLSRELYCYQDMENIGKMAQFLLRKLIIFLDS